MNVLLARAIERNGSAESNQTVARGGETLLGSVLKRKKWKRTGILWILMSAFTGVSPGQARVRGKHALVTGALTAGAATVLRVTPPAQAVNESAPVSPESLANAIESSLAQGRVDKARDALRQLLARDQLDPDILLRVGIQLAQHGFYAEAEQSFARCARENPDITEAPYNLALALFAQQKFPEALKALEGTPYKSEAEGAALLYLRGKIENALGKTKEAEHDLAEAFSKAPQEENYALDLGLFYLQQRTYRQADEIFERGARLNPASAFLALGLSLAQSLDGRFQECLKNLDHLLKLEPESSSGYLLRAYALYRLGRMDEAEKAADRGLGNPNPTPYLYYLHADLLLSLQSRDFNRIVDELAIASRGIPKCSFCDLARSVAHERMGNNPAAIADLESAVETTPDFAEAWKRLSGLYKVAGRGDDAARALDTFQKIETHKESGETETLRNLFIQMLTGSNAPAP
ncbi:MAG: tetratricopeptide repeat protein [Terriglobia bacterium]